MSEQNGKIPLEKSAQKSYEDLSLKELKNIAESRELTPQGNQSKKESWIKALGEYDQDKTNQDKINQDVIPNSEGLPNENNPGIGELGSAAAQESIFDSVINRLEQRGVNIDTLSLRFDGQEALSYRNGDVNKQNLTDQQSELLKSALNDPQNFEGSVTIKSGNKTLLKIENGQVTRDAVGLTSKATTLSVESPYQKYSKESTKQGLERTKEVLSNIIKDGIPQDKAKEIISTSQDPGYKDLKENTGQANADKVLDNLSNNVVAQAQIKDQGITQTQEKEQALEKAR